MRRLVILLLLAATLGLVPRSGGTVSVVYAGSLVSTMEGPLAAALAARTGIRFSGEPKGSKELANLIRAGLRNPDVFIAVDPKLLDGLRGPAHGNFISSYTVFGSARMLVGYSPRSPYRALFEAAAHGKRSILSVLLAPGVRIGRTDPRLDPKGALTIRSVKLLVQEAHLPASTAQKILARAKTFPEEDLLARVETGELDAGFFYSTETSVRQLPVVELPGPANLSRQITYAIAILNAAPHPQQARRFVDFVLHGPGKAILERAGLQYFAHPREVGTH